MAGSEVRDSHGATHVMNELEIAGGCSWWAAHGGLKARCTGGGRCSLATNWPSTCAF